MVEKKLLGLLARVKDEKTLGRFLRVHVPDLQDFCSTSPFQTWNAALCLWRWLCPRMAYPGTHTILPPDMTAIQMFRLVVGERAGVWCGGAARMLAACLRGVGLPACEYSYGYRDTGLTHATVIVQIPEVGTTWDRFALLDAYMGYYYVDSKTEEPLLFDELVQHVIDGRFSSIALHVEANERPFIIRRDEDPRLRAFLFPDGMVPDEREEVDALHIYRGATMTPDKLIRGVMPGGGEPQLTPFGRLVEEARGEQSVHEFLLRLLLVNPWFDPFAPANDDGGSDRAFRNRLIEILAGGAIK